MSRYGTVDIVCMLKKAVYEIIYPGDKRDEDPNIEYYSDNNEFVTTSDPMEYCSLCLLRKSSLASFITYASMKVDYRGSGVCNTRVPFVHNMDSPC